MFVNHHSRKQRQLKTLVKDLNNLLKNTDVDLISEIEKIVSKIKFLVIQLKSVISAIKMKRILGTAALIIGLSFNNTVSAQWFAFPVQEPFNLQNGDDTQINSLEFADFDNDGDYDFITGEYSVFSSGYNYGYALGFQFQENNGNATNPNFSSITTNPFGLIPFSPTLPNIAVFQWFKAIDLDNDGDFDILSNVVQQDASSYTLNTDFLYYENVGTPSSPQFSPAVTNPFGLNSSQSIQHTTLGDIDNDGDIDLLGFSLNYSNYSANAIFIENTGNASSPNFSNPQLNQFGLPSGVFSLITLEDIDNDGDLDILFSDEDSNPNMSTILYAENTGNANIAQFPGSPAALISNPFGLSFPQNWQGMALLNFKDLDGDNDNDLIAGTDDDINLYFENVGAQQSPSFECINYSCVDPGTGSGTYVSLLACETSCSAPISFECDFPAGCYDPGDGSGLYTYLADCNLDCSNSTSVNENGIKNFIIYPNPVNNILNISVEKKVRRIEIYDVIGKIVISEINPKNSINVEQLESGLYSIVIIFANNRIVKKFSK